MLRISCVVALILTSLAPARSSMQTAGPAPVPRPQGGAPTGSARPGLPPRDTPIEKPGTGRIRGRVLSADTGAPLRRAQILVAAGQLGVRRFTTTDAEGRYEIVELAEGRYNVTASKGGYVTLQYGQRRAFEPGRPVAVAEGQDVSQVDIALPRGSVITGRITDEFGEPIAGAQVQVQRYQYGPSGQRRLTFAGGNGLTLTDDRGEFRAYGLMPGEYVVSGIVRQPMFQAGANANDASEGYAPTYYPGTPNPAQAELLTLGLGQEMAVQLTLQAARMARVSGVVTDAEGRPLREARVTIRPASNEGMMTMSSAVIGPDGTFAVTNVPPGSHVLDVVTQARAQDAAPEVASMPLTIGNEDITGLRLTTAPAATVSGTVVFEGTSPRQGVMGGLRITVQSAEDQAIGRLLGFGFDGGAVREDASFQLRGMGSVLFRAINLGPWMLKSVRLNGEDITDTPLDLTGANVEGLRVVLTDRQTDVSGGVTDEDRQPVREFVVVVQPLREIAGPSLQRFLRTARPDQDGKFGLRGIPPADYIATAVETLEQGGEWDPEYRSRLRDAGRRFSIKEGESIQLDLPLSGL
jgi:protocatechuate 3,4-dioxygenase beta subunit